MPTVPAMFPVTPRSGARSARHPVTPGRIKIPLTGGKSIAGSLACFLAVLAVTLRVTGNFNASLAIAVAATVLEAAPTRDFDNLLVPAGAGLVALAVL